MEQETPVVVPGHSGKREKDGGGVRRAVSPDGGVAMGWCTAVVMQAVVAAVGGDDRVRPLRFAASRPSRSSGT